MAKRYLLLSVVSVLIVLAVFSCTTNAPAPAVKPGPVKSVTVRVSLPELAGKVDPSVKAGFYEELKVSYFKLIIENAQRRVEKDITVFKRTGLDYEFTYSFSGTDILEAGVYDITIQAYPEQVGRYQGINRPILEKTLKNYLLQAGDPTEIKDPGKDKVHLSWVPSGNLRINIVFDDSVDATGGYYISTGNLSGIATNVTPQFPTGTDPATMATFTTNGATPGVYNILIDATVLAYRTDPSDIIWANRYGRIPVSVTVFPVVDATAVVKFGTSNSTATDLAVKLGVELKRQDLITGVSNLQTSPAVLGNNIYVTYFGNDGATLTVFTPNTSHSFNLLSNLTGTGNVTFITSPLVEPSGTNLHIIYVGMNTENLGGVLRQIQFNTSNNQFSIVQTYQFPQEDGTSVSLVVNKELAMLPNFILYTVQRGTNGNFFIRAIHKQNWGQPTIVSRDLGAQSGSLTPTSPLAFGTNRAFIAYNGIIWRLTFLEGNVTTESTGLTTHLSSRNLRNLAAVGDTIYLASTDGRIGRVINASGSNWNYQQIATLSVDVTTDPVVRSNDEIFLGYTSGGKGYLWSSSKGRFLTVADEIASTPLIANNGKIYVATKNGANDYNFVYEIDVNDLYVYRIWRVTAPFVSSPTLAGGKLEIFANTQSPSRFSVQVDATGLAEGWPKYRGTLDNSARRQ